MFDKLIRIVQTGQNIEEQDMTWTWLFRFIGHLQENTAHHQQIETLQFITEIQTQEQHDPPLYVAPAQSWFISPRNTLTSRSFTHSIRQGLPTL